MGDYHTRHAGGGRIEFVCKLAVLDDWRYVRRDEAAALVSRDAGVDTNIRHALASPATLFRFPFPWEDGLSRPEDIEGRDMFATVEFVLPPELAHLVKGIEHREVWLGVRQARGSYSFNVAIPCPLSEGFVLKHSQGAPVALADIYGERYDAMKRARTIFRCGYCETPFSVSEAELEVMRRYIPKGCRDRVTARPEE